MFIIAVVHSYAFGYKSFMDPTKKPFLKDVRNSVKPLLKNFTDVVQQGDVINDATETFAPPALLAILGKPANKSDDASDQTTSDDANTYTRLSNNKVDVDGLLEGELIEIMNNLNHTRALKKMEQYNPNEFDLDSVV